MGNVIAVSDADFQEVVLNSDKPVLLDFWAEWCGPCRALAPTLAELAEDFAGKVVIAKMNVDENQQTPAQFGIRSIPTLIVFKNGQAVETLVGALPKAEFVKVLEQQL